MGGRGVNGGWGDPTIRSGSIRTGQIKQGEGRLPRRLHLSYTAPGNYTQRRLFHIVIIPEKPAGQLRPKAAKFFKLTYAIRAKFEKFGTRSKPWGAGQSK